MASRWIPEHTRPGPPSFPLPKWLPYLLILLAVWIPFGTSLANERIGDDRVRIPTRLSPSHVEDALQLWGENYWGAFDNSGLYRPLSLTALYAQRSVFALSTLPYRVINLLLYSLCGILCYQFLRQLTEPVAATAAAMLFVLHPAHVEVIVTAYGQVEMMAAALVLLALLGHVQAVRTGLVSWTLLAALAFLAAMLSKEVAVSFPVLAVLTRGIWLQPGERGWRRWAAPGDAIYLAVLAIYGTMKYLAIGALAVPDTAATMARFSLYRRLYTVFTHGIGNYLRLTLFPESQSIVYDVFPSASADALWISAALLLIAVAGYLLGTRPVLYAAAWFLSTWFVFSNLAVPTGVFVAERCLFLPVLAVCLLFGLLVQHALTLPAGASRAVVSLGLGLTLLLAGAQAADTAQDWRTEESALRAAIEEYPDSPLARSALALTLLLDPPSTPSEQTEAATLLHAVLQKFPMFPEAHRGLGLLAKTRGDFRGAVTHLERGLQLRPRDVMIQQDLAECRRLAGDSR